MGTYGFSGQLLKSDAGSFGTYEYLDFAVYTHVNADML